MAPVYFRVLKTFDLGYRTTLICTFVLSLYSGILTPSKNHTHTHCQNRAVRSLSAEAHYSKPLVPAASVISVMFSAAHI